MVPLFLICVVSICSFFIWIFFISRKKTLIDFCSSLKKILSLKFEIWNWKIWNWKFGIWKFGIENLKLEIENLTFGIESLMLRHCHFVVVCSCWNLGHCMVGHILILALGHFLNCCIFWAWCNLNNVGESWILAMLAICDVVEWILGALKLWKFCCIGSVEQIHDECKQFVGMCKSYFTSMANFCGYGYGKKLWWHEIFGHWKFLLGMRFSLVILMMGLTLVFVDFSGESTGIGWCHHKIFGGKD